MSIDTASPPPAPRSGGDAGKGADSSRAVQGPDAHAVQQRALSTLALHAARAMGSDAARVMGLDAIEPAVAVNDGWSRPAILHANMPRGRPLAEVRPGGSRRGGPRHADLVAFEPQRPLASAYDDMIEEVAREHAVAPHLVRAVIKVESNFQANARSPKGAVGLMQVMPATGRRFGASDLKDPRGNLDAGTRYLRWLLNRFDEDLTLAVAAYNAGEGAVEKYGRQIPPYPETQNYVRKVLGHLGMGVGGRPGNASDAGNFAYPGDTGAGANGSATRDAAGGDNSEPRARPDAPPRTGAAVSRGQRSVRTADGITAPRNAEATLRDLSGWLGAILTSGSATGARRTTGGNGRGPAWPGARPAMAEQAGAGWSDDTAAARSHDTGWPVQDDDDTRSRGPV